MTHRAETILETLRERLTYLSITDDRVQRCRIWPVEQVPALSIESGEDAPVETGRRLGFQDRALEVAITAYVKATENPETQLRAIAAEVYSSLFTDVTQGLSFVLDTHWLGDGRPTTNTDTETRTATMTMIYRITYRHQITTPES